MDCELCGKKEATYISFIEGAEQKVCEKCATFGKIKRELPQSAPPPRRPTAMPRTTSLPSQQKKEMVMSLSADFPKLIRKVREKTGLTQKEFANKLAERESLIHHWETGESEPSIATARKIEKMFGVTLVEQEEVVLTETKKVKPDDITLGDFVEIRKRRVH